MKRNNIVMRWLILGDMQSIFQHEEHLNDLAFCQEILLTYIEHGLGKYSFQEMFYVLQDEVKWEKTVETINSVSQINAISFETILDFMAKK